MTTLVIGGGWSGLAAAARLSQQGYPVHLLESAKQLGGRARSVNWQGLEIDNGQHLMIGAYRHTLSLLRDIGANESELFLRKPLDIDVQDPDYPTLKMNAGSGIPWPLSLLWALYKDNDLSIVSDIAKLSLRSRFFNHQTDCSVAKWLSACNQSDRLIRQLWEPLCLATLNTPIETASASVFATVINETFRHRRDSDLLIPIKPLGQTLPDFTERYLRQSGNKVSLQQRIVEIAVEDKQVRGVVTQTGHFIDADQIILATPHDISRQLLTPHLHLPAFETHPIATVYLQYSDTIMLPNPIIGLSGGISQWAFDRSDLRPGLITVVISGPGKHEALDKQALCDRVAEELQQALATIDQAPVDSWVIREKKATFACNVDIQRQRPNNRTEITGLWLAGDYVANPYPATLEGAVLNGQQTAMQLMKQKTAIR